VSRQSAARVTEALAGAWIQDANRRRADE
jgi:hypothetical protein